MTPEALAELMNRIGFHLSIDCNAYEKRIGEAWVQVDRRAALTAMQAGRLESLLAEAEIQLSMKVVESQRAREAIGQAAQVLTKRGGGLSWLDPELFAQRPSYPRTTIDEAIESVNAHQKARIRHLEIELAGRDLRIRELEAKLAAREAKLAAREAKLAAREHVPEDVRGRQVSWAEFKRADLEERDQQQHRWLGAPSTGSTTTITVPAGQQAMIEGSWVNGPAVVTYETGQPLKITPGA